MQQNYKIFVKNIPVILTSEHLDENGSNHEQLIVNTNSPNKIKEVIDYVEAHPDHREIYLSNSDVHHLFKTFKDFFVTVEAAGGIVWNPSNAILLIYRHNKWDLPKGKLEAGEDPQETALREITEECGIKQLALNHFFGTTYHTFWQHNQRILKVTYWFDISCDDPENINPQTEEGIETIRWMDANGIKKAMENTFPNLRNVLQTYLEIMEQ